MRAFVPRGKTLPALGAWVDRQDTRRLGLLLPAALLLFLVALVPFGRIVWTSLHRSTPTAPSEFVGFSNYLNLLANSDWWTAVGTSLVVVAAVTSVQVVLGVVFGAALHRVALAWPVMRILVVTPLAVISVVNVVTWRDAFATGYLAQWFGSTDPGSFFASAQGQLLAVSIAEAWRGTFMVVAVVALALARVPANLSAAVLADGANGYQHWRIVVLPAIGPALAAITAFRIFDTYRVIDGPLLAYGPSATLTTVPQLAWSTQFDSLELGLGAAMSVLLVVVVGVLAALVLPLLRVGRPS